MGVVLTIFLAVHIVFCGCDQFRGNVAIPFVGMIALIALGFGWSWYAVVMIRGADGTSCSGSLYRMALADIIIFCAGGGTPILLFFTIGDGRRWIEKCLKFTFCGFPHYMCYVCKCPEGVIDCCCNDELGRDRIRAQMRAQMRAEAEADAKAAADHQAGAAGGGGGGAGGAGAFSSVVAHTHTPPSPSESDAPIAIAVNTPPVRDPLPPALSQGCNNSDRARIQIGRSAVAVNHI